MPPYKRKYNKKKSYRKRRGKGLNKKQQYQVKKIISKKAELKFKTVAISNGSVTFANPLVYDFNLDTVINQGDGFTDRNGARITIKKLEYSIFIRQLLPQSAETIRVIAYRYYTPNPPQNMPQDMTDFWPALLDSGVRYKKLYDRSMNVGSISNILSRRIKLTFNNLGMMKYNGNTNTIDSGNVRILILSSNTTTSALAADGFIKTKFNDI